MIIFWTLLGLLALFGTLVCYSALVASARADEWEEERKHTESTFEKRVISFFPYIEVYEPKERSDNE